MFRRRNVRRRNVRRRNVRRKNARRTRSYIPRSLGYPKQRVYYFTRYGELSALTAGNDGTDVLVTKTFTLVDIPAPTDFTALFDWYKINYVVVTLLPYFSEVNTPGSTGTFTAHSTPANLRIFTAVDYNDATTPASINEIREYQNCKVTQYIKGHVRKFKPRPTIVSDDSTPDVQYPIGNPWISTDATGDDCVHYGLKIGVDTSLLSAGQIANGDVILRVEVKYYLAFKAPR